MDTHVSMDKDALWTWADQLSTYRFWGLCVFYVLSVIGVNYLLSTVQWVVLDQMGVEIDQMGDLVIVRAIGSLFGLYLAWAATRWRTVPLLIFFALLELAGAAMILLPGTTTTIVIRAVGSAILGIGFGALTLAVPALIAGGRGGAEVFLVSFGVVSTMSTLGGMRSLAFAEFSLESGVHAIIIVGVPIAIGALFLLPVKQQLFSEPPSPREYALTPTRRNPAAVALLFLVPFYWLYWLYRAHGEVASLAPSRTLLSPRGAVLGAIFVPLLYPVAMTTLIEVLNRRASESGRPSLRSPWVIFVCSLLFLPVGMALVQSAINQSMMGAVSAQATAY